MATQVAAQTFAVGATSANRLEPLADWNRSRALVGSGALPASHDHPAELRRQRLRIERDIGPARFDAHVVCRVCGAGEDLDRAIGMCPSCQRALGLTPYDAG
jgi:hypothetical protein